MIPVALEPFADGTAETWHWFVCAGWTLWMLWSEGYRGFQKAFAPRVVARSFWVGANPTPVRVLLAPAFAMALFYASRRRLILSWTVVIGIVTAVVLVRFAPQPYRGIVDFGVVAGLIWGLVVLAMFFVRALVGRPVGVDLALPPNPKGRGDRGPISPRC